VRKTYTLVPLWSPSHGPSTHPETSQIPLPARRLCDRLQDISEKSIQNRINSTMEFLHVQRERWRSERQTPRQMEIRKTIGISAYLCYLPNSGHTEEYSSPQV
jgi:hypothetical protein